MAAAVHGLMVAAQSGPVQSDFQRGAQAVHEGRSADAEAAFRHAIQLAPNLAEAHLDLGLVLGREGKLDASIAELRVALGLQPELTSAHMFLGIFLYQAGRRDEARAELERETVANPGNAEALTWLGTVDMAQGHPERATAAFDRALQLTPDDLTLLESSGRAHSLVAQRDYRRMATLDPDSWHVHRVQAMLLAEQGRHADAIAEYNAAIARQQSNPDLYEALGDEYREANRMEDARTAYTRELELSPANAVALYNLGSTEIELGSPAAGIEHLQAMMKISAAPAVADYYLGRGLAAVGRGEEAATHLEKSAREDGAGEVAKRSDYELARLYRRLQRPVEAEHALAEYTRLRAFQESAKQQQVLDWRRLAKPEEQPVAVTASPIAP